MKRSELIAVLVGEILARKHTSRPLRVAIDGRCGSGKTMLADEIACAMNGRGTETLRTSIDGFHHPAEHRYRQGEYSARGYYEDAFNYSAVIECVVQPGDNVQPGCRESESAVCGKEKTAPEGAVSFLRPALTSSDSGVVRRRCRSRHAAVRRRCRSRHALREGALHLR